MVSDTHHRRSIRLHGYDYAQAGAYFVTICTQNRESFFGTILNGQIQLNALGRIVEEEWLRTAAVRTNVILDAFVVMPKHVHGIIALTDQIDETLSSGVSHQANP